MILLRQQNEIKYMKSIKASQNINDPKADDEEGEWRLFWRTCTFLKSAGTSSVYCNYSGFNWFLMTTIGCQKGKSFRLVRRTRNRSMLILGGTDYENIREKCKKNPKNAKEKKSLWNAIIADQNLKVFPAPAICKSVIRSPVFFFF